VIAPQPPTGTLLLCIDLQPVFLRAVVDGGRVQRRCEFAVAAAVGLGLPVAFTEQVPQKLGGTAPALLALAIRDALVRQQRVEHLLLCGIETPICVYQTAIAALAEGLQVTLLSDCIGARHPEDSAACLVALRAAGVHVLPSETIYYALLRDVQHPFFKPYTQLVKSHA
jgi:nicotinamidase-related amidase